jgi:hypothetical protein
LKTNPQIKDVHAFGDRLNIVMENSKRDFPNVQKYLNNEQIQVQEWRVINPSLENIFISLMTRKLVVREVSSRITGRLGSKTP